METGTSVPSSNHFRSYVNSTSKRHQKINSAIHIYMDRINNRLVFKVKDGYKLELQTPVTMKLLGSTKNQYTNQRMKKMYQVLKWLK